MSAWKAAWVVRLCRAILVVVKKGRTKDSPCYGSVTPLPGKLNCWYISMWRRTLSIIWASTQSVARRRLSGWEPLPSLHVCAPLLSGLPVSFSRRVASAEGFQSLKAQMLPWLICWRGCCGYWRQGGCTGDESERAAGCGVSLLRICGWTMLSNYPRYVFCKGYIHDERVNGICLNGSFCTSWLEPMSFQEVMNVKRVKDQSSQMC